MLLQVKSTTNNAFKRNEASKATENIEFTTVSPTIDRELLVSWLFLIGSLIFTLDSILEILRGVSFSAILHVSASVLFTIGSVLFIPSNKEK